MKISAASILATLMTAITIVAADPTTEGTNGDSARQASPDEMSIQKHYTLLSYSTYCGSVTYNGDLTSCPICDVFDGVTLIKTFKSKFYDTNAMVVRDDKRQEVVAIFQGTMTLRGWMAVSCLYRNRDTYTIFDIEMTRCNLGLGWPWNAVSCNERCSDP